MKTLSEILYKAGTVKIAGNTHISVSEIQFDSRKVRQGDVFVAVRGTQSDGHQFIAKAIESGARAVVCEEMPEQFTDGVTYAQVKDSSYALGVIAGNYFDNPSAELILIGVS